jgi:hypothetical protein
MPTQEENSMMKSIHAVRVPRPVRSTVLFSLSMLTLAIMLAAQLRGAGLTTPETGPPQRGGEQPPRRVDPRRTPQPGITKGASKSSMNKLLDRFAKNNRAHQDYWNGRVAAVARRLDRSLADQQEAIEKVLKSDRQYQQYVRQLNSLSRQGRQMGHAFKALNARYRTTLEAVPERARVDRDQTEAAIRQALRTLPVASGPKNPTGLKLSLRVDHPRTIEKKARLTVVEIGDISEATGEPKPQTQFTLQPPYHDIPQEIATSTTIEDAEWASSAAWGETGQIRASRSAISVPLPSAENELGGFAYSRIGDFITVPPGYTRLRVTTNVSMYYRLDANAYLGVGIASANLYLTVGYVGPGGYDLAHFEQINNLEAAGLWEELEVDHPRSEFSTTAILDIPDTGGEYLINVGGTVLSFAAYNGSAHTSFDATVNSISIELLR